MQHTFYEWFQLCCGGGLFHNPQRGISQMLCSPPKERSQVCFGNTSNRVDVGTATIILGQVATEQLINIGRAQHQQEAQAAPHPQGQLRKQERNHHSQPCLNILQRQVFCCWATMRWKLWSPACNHMKPVAKTWPDYASCTRCRQVAAWAPNSMCWDVPVTLT